MPCRTARSVGISACLTALLLLAGCSNAPTTRGKVPDRDMEAKEWGQSDVNRMATLSIQANLQSLYTLMDKLYRRNPQEWRKGGFDSREQAMKAVKEAIENQQPWPDLMDQRDIDGMSMALAPEFSSDRVAAFTWATADMLITAYGGRTTLYLIHGLDAQTVYNASRNLEIANWMLTHRKLANGQPMLLTNEINTSERNLSFEREFGKMIARNDLMADVVSEKYRRAVIGYVQGLAGGSLLQFLPVQAVAH
ncbi:hypothetical protein [Comamonas odontotermitis]|uniref:hypothetical protein n=1 Tax=Comamonas TaxID=283 RepID=UPI001CC3C3C2|nr:hypothetical protein [Comamonas odontotermitis]UBB16015.1 hypothetical protein LAD35_14390 [Comamonas odontotermitis]